MMKLTLLLIISSFILKAESCEKKSDCKGPVKQDCVCTMQYDPVCGCDGKTYGNACTAGCEGVKSWTKGECPK